MTTTTTEAARRRLATAHADYLAAHEAMQSAVRRRWAAWQEIHRDCPHGEVALACRVPGCVQGRRYIEADDAMQRARIACDSAQLEWGSRFDAWVGAVADDQHSAARY